VEKIKEKLGISGVLSHAYAWHHAGDGASGEGGAQVDLVIDRNDGIINLCEMKFAGGEYAIDKKGEEGLRKKAEVFRRTTKTKKALHITMVTTYGLLRNSHSQVVQSEVTLADLFLGDHRKDEMAEKH
jgi:hypothetical protein